MSELQVPGFDVVELLGYGSGGEVWLARERATGTPVALKRLRVGADLAARDRLRREAAVLAGVDHPHVVRLRSVVGNGDGDALVLVLALAPNGSLAQLLATRRCLSPGEVVTLAVPLAQALAAVHAQGLVHGDVTPANVLFGSGGRPLLSDLGVARLLGAESHGSAVHGTRGFLDPAVAAGDPQGPASDVHGLAATCLAALTGAAPYDDDGRRVPVPAGVDPAVLAVLEGALAPDPRDRPFAAAFAVAVFDAAAAEPVRLDRAAARTLGAPVVDDPAAAPAVGTHQVRPRPQPGQGPAESPARREWSARLRPGTVVSRLRARGRGALAVAAAAVAVTLAAVTGVAWAGAGRGDEPTGLAAGRAGGPSVAPTSTAPAAPPTDAPGATAPTGPRVTVPPAGPWARRLAALDAARSRAFATGDLAGLGAVYAPGSPARSRDARVLRRLSRAGLHADGLQLRATSVRPLDRLAGRVRLAVTDVMPAYRLVDGGDAVVERRTGRGLRSWTLQLARTDDGWRVYDVARG
ncbi:MAG: protein kinase [Sporichthyaceae bacterium]